MQVFTIEVMSRKKLYPNEVEVTISFAAKMLPSWFKGVGTKRGDMSDEIRRRCDPKNQDGTINTEANGLLKEMMTFLLRKQDELIPLFGDDEFELLNRIEVYNGDH
jgi:hypothetical protein